jgi:hypothetical protein
VLAGYPDGDRLLIGGAFTSVGGQARSRIARLTPTGTVDGSFAASVSAAVWSLSVQADGKVVVGGGFAQVNGQARPRLARLEANGAIDASVEPTSNGQIFAVSQQGDGKIWIGGGFSTVGGFPRERLARLSVPDAAIDSLDVDGNRVVWSRAGAAPELIAGPVLELSLDGTNFSTIGSMTRNASLAWQRQNVSLPPVGQTYWLRVVGMTASGIGNGSSGTVLRVRVFHRTSLADPVFANGFE